MQKALTSRKRAVLLSALAVALFAWFMRDASLVDVWLEVRLAKLGFLGLGVVAMTGSYLARVVRWQFLLRPVGYTHFWTVARATVVGYAASFLLPARAGDVLRPYVLARQEGLRATSVFATVVLERVLDLMVVLAMLGAFVWSVAGGFGESRAMMRSVQASGATAAVAAIVLFGFLQFVAWHPERVGVVALRGRYFLPDRFVRWLAGAATAFSEGLAVARTPRLLGQALAWSVAVWILAALQIWWITLAFGIEMPFAGSFLQQALLVAGVAVPTPGAVGSFHEAYRIGATVFFGGSEQAAIGAAIVLHAVTFIPLSVFGIGFMLRDGLTVDRLRQMAEGDGEIEERV